MKRRIAITLLLLFLILTACAPQNPTPAAGEYTIPIYEEDEIGKSGKYVVFHLHCLYFNKGIEGASLYEEYYWANSTEIPPSCENTYTGLPLHSGDTVQIGLTEKLPEELWYTYSAMYYSGESGTAASEFQYEITINMNQTPPECPLEYNNLTLYDCTVRRKDPALIQ